MIFLFFIIALLYASAGFGGGSMYLAVLNSVFPSAGVGNKVHGLLCNTGVTLQGSWLWGRAYGKALQQGWPILLCAAISCSFTAYYFRNEGIVQWAMSIALIVAGILLILQDKIESLQFKFHQSVLLSISTLVGALAGMTGIGGGIYLSPILHLSKWQDAKSIATLCSILILSNSIISLIILMGFSSFSLENINWSLPLASIIGGTMGSISGIRILTQKQIKWLTAIILLAVGNQFILNVIL